MKKNILYGFLMGAADIVPGVSGGTVAFVLGIYTRLINAISAFDHNFLKLVFLGKFSEAAQKVDLKFLITLFIGILSAILILSRVMHYALSNHPIYTWSLFFGLITASIIVVSKTINNFKSAQGIISLIIGTIIGVMVVSSVPVTTSNSHLMIFLSGCIAITAMILPGISGSFILLILGKYLFITSAIKNPIIIENLKVIIVFSTGCAVGLLSFSKFLKFILSKYNTIALSLLTGFMIGSLKKLWPFREVIESQVIRGKTHVLRDAIVLPNFSSTQFYISLGIMIFGFLCVILLEKKSSN